MKNEPGFLVSRNSTQVFMTVWKSGCPDGAPWREADLLFWARFLVNGWQGKPPVAMSELCVGTSQTLLWSTQWPLPSKKALLSWKMWPAMVFNESCKFEVADSLIMRWISDGSVSMATKSGRHEDRAENSTEGARAAGFA